MWIKICGIRDLDAVRAAAELSVDAVGFVFAASRRRVAPEEARALGEELPPNVLRVGVFQGMSPDEVRRAAEVSRVDAVQLHDLWDDGVLGSFRHDGRQVIRCLSLAPGAVPLLPGEADYLLVDGPRPGSGRTADWEAAARFAAGSVPMILAGGLNPGNVQEAMERVRPFGVDVSSGVEQDGRKDPELMRRFVEAVRGCNC